MLRPFSCLLVCTGLWAATGFPYETELSDTAVREGYFLGQRNDGRTRDFFALYTKNLPVPKKGPYLSEIRLLTPFAQVVQISSQTTSGYSAQQAHLDYQHRGDTVLVVVHIQLTATYGQIEADNSAKDAAGKSKRGLTLRREDFWQDFHYGLKQKEEWIEPHSMRGEPEYGGADSHGSGGLVGAWVYIEFDARNVQSDDAEVHVITIPDQEATATFDLARLR